MKKYKKRWDKLDAYYRRQRLMGIALIIAGILVGILAEGDFTALIFFSIPGLYAIFSKELMIYDEDIDEIQRLKENRWKEL